MAQKIEKVKFKYLFDKSYNPTYCSGGFGGITPKDEIVFNFFLERHPIPYSETQKINDDGSLGNIVEREPEYKDDTADVIRYVESGVIMNLETAKEVRAWLDKHIQILEKNKIKD